MPTLQTKLGAWLVLALVVSPVTAPFRAFDLLSSPSSSELEEQNPASETPTLVTSPGRLTVRPAVAVLVCRFGIQLTVSLIARPTAPTASLHAPPLQSTVLRV